MRIAITGTIGSGKSTVANILEKRGYKVIYSDVINAELLSDATYINRLKEVFPDCVVSGKVDRKKLSAKVFGSENNRIKLNSIAHPIIKKLVLDRINELEGVIFVEVPLLKEAAMEDIFDKIWLVTSDKDTQLKRVSSRDKRELEEVEAILLSQAKEKDYVLPLIVIHNDGNLIDLEKYVDLSLKKLSIYS